MSKFAKQVVELETKIKNAISSLNETTKLLEDCMKEINKIDLMEG
jgi:hypothetical protein